MYELMVIAGLVMAAAACDMTMAARRPERVRRALPSAPPPAAPTPAPQEVVA